MGLFDRTRNGSNGSAVADEEEDRIPHQSAVIDLIDSL